MKTYNIKEHIKEHFFIYPTSKLRVRQIERELILPLPSIIRYTKELVNEKILKKEEIGGIALFSADRTSKKFLVEKKLHNIKSLYDIGLIDYLVKELSNPVIILFGSYAKGEDIETSDIDLYIQIPKKELKLEKYEKILHRNLQLFVYPRLDKIENPHLKNNIINGIILNNYLEVFK